VAILRLDPVLAGLLFRLVLKLTLDLFLFSRPWALDLSCVNLASAHLPLHKLAESAVRVGGQLLICAFLGNLAIGVDANNAIRALDGRQTVRNADRGVVVGQQLA
jgi:hypothetical protein